MEHRFEKPASLRLDPLLEGNKKLKTQEELM